MENTMIIQLTNEKAAGLIHELEELHLIKVIKQNASSKGTKLSEKYKGIINKEQGKLLQKHINQMRNEWNNT